MKILFVNKYFWNKGGSEAVFFEEMKLLESLGHEIIPFSMAHPNNNTSDYSKYFVQYVDFETSNLIDQAKSGLKIVYSFDARAKIESLLEAVSPDIAHFHVFQHQLSPSIIQPIVKRNIPIVATVHDLKLLCPVYTMYSSGSVCEKCKGGKYYNCALNKCNKNSAVFSLVNTVEMYIHRAANYNKHINRLIAPSRFYYDKMSEYGLDKKKLLYIPNPMDSSLMPNYQTCDGKYVLYFGRISKEKGLKTIIDCATLLRTIQFIIVGSGPYLSELKGIASGKKLWNIEFIDHVEKSKLGDFIANSMCVVHPAEWYENCPMSIIESYMYSKPVVASNIGGIPEMITHGIDGFLVEPGDSQKFAEKIKYLCDNLNVTTKMGGVGKKKLMDKYSREKHVDSLISLYNDVLTRQNIS